MTLPAGGAYRTRMLSISAAMSLLAILLISLYLAALLRLPAEQWRGFAEIVGLLFGVLFAIQAAFHRRLWDPLVDCLDRSGTTLQDKVDENGCGKYPRIQVPTPPAIDFMKRSFACYGIPEEMFRDRLACLPEPAAILVTSMMTYWYPGVEECIRIVKDVFPGCPVVLGGVSLGSREKAVLLTVDGRRLLVGVAPGRVQTLLVLNDGTARENDFAEQLEAVSASAGSPASGEPA